ncbi:hypothetical protein L6637_22665 [Bradyrhizobium sp. WYCCWR 12774]|uniref:Beta-ribofuranosylaminobenzene 5'-phosphate synthase n=2 Tax=Nitrobacteraceae TaxID=41294 RepID=A0ABS9LRX0_9BRAD|nr:hypothetical protein [Bradyrhizobium zhengyangense]MCG2669772.1 hypothetical protein [Bradyrhizobium zhengyangense]
MGLVDLAGVSARSFCGIGFSLSGPPTIWRVEDASTVSLTGVSHLDKFAFDEINKTAKNLADRAKGGFSAHLECSPPQHVGFGTKTSLLLSLITAVDRLKRMNLTNDQIKKLSGRGGASGVGVSLFFTGGVIWDGGHAKQPGLRFSPSSVSAPVETPPVLARWLFPESWLVGLIIPDETTFHGVQEVSFFQEKTPIPDEQALLTMSSLYHGVVPAFATADIQLMKLSLDEIHTVGFKCEELRAQSNRTKDAFRKLQALPSIAVGMSSLGPLIYCIFHRDTNGERLLEETSNKLGLSYLGTFPGCNVGFGVTPL